MCDDARIEIIACEHQAHGATLAWRQRDASWSPLYCFMLRRRTLSTPFFGACQPGLLARRLLAVLVMQTLVPLLLEAIQSNAA